ncbi:acylphosphatase-2-like [Scomber japonicus]|uniref:acylphosphatase-2-like n=1 Tax=Scomber japonicus TaxID=13676 RepID=UPI00230610A6|nr:acylphosphatase-2-like [Scomber japonicus]
MATTQKLTSLDFEIFGNVQGVCFRMYTEEEGRSLGLSGWVKNTRQGSVIGQVQGPADRVSEMKYWLEHVGSPSSRIDRAVFSNQKDISKLELHGFSTQY